MEQLITFAGNHPMLSAAWGTLVILIIFTSIKIKMSPIKQLTPQELTFKVNKEQAVVVDIRADKDFKANHIIDSKHLTAEKITKNELTSLEKDKDKPIIVVCAAGLTASKAANELFKAGFNQVSVLKGGINAWLSAGLPLTKK